MRMKKPFKKSNNKARKSNFEEKFSLMVAEYNKAKEILGSMEEGTDEYTQQKKLCEKLFARAERFINAN